MATAPRVGRGRSEAGKNPGADDRGRKEEKKKRVSMAEWRAVEGEGVRGRGVRERKKAKFQLAGRMFVESGLLVRGGSLIASGPLGCGDAVHVQGRGGRSRSRNRGQEAEAGSWVREEEGRVSL